MEEHKFTYVINFQLSPEWFDENKNEEIKAGEDTVSRKYNTSLEESLEPDWTHYTASSRESAQEKLFDYLKNEWPTVPSEAWIILECFIQED